MFLLAPCGSHPLPGLGYLLLFERRKVESRKWMGPVIEGIAAARVPRHTVLETAARPRLDVDGTQQPDPKCQPAGGEREFDLIAKRTPQAVRQNLAAVCIDASDSPDVPLQLAVFNQCRDGYLGRPLSLD